MRPRNDPAFPVWRLTPLCASNYPAGRQRVTCVLYRVAYRRPLTAGTSRPPLYAIGMESSADRSLRPAGCDEARARDLFRTLRRMTVTPCTLGDIMEDLGLNE
ncbi:MAG: hypothetical protein MJ192_00060 [Clostridia bacterium]|nr:hypothetical protein [Clostridia bacterium]